MNQCMGTRGGEVCCVVLCVPLGAEREGGTAWQFPVQHLHFDAVLRMMWIRKSRLPAFPHSPPYFEPGLQRLPRGLSAKWNQTAKTKQHKIKWAREQERVSGERIEESQSLQHLATFCFNFALLKSGSRHLNGLFMLPRRWQRRHRHRRSHRRLRRQDWQLLFGFSMQPANAPCFMLHVSCSKLILCILTTYAVVYSIDFISQLNYFKFVEILNLCLEKIPIILHSIYIIFF